MIPLLATVLQGKEFGGGAVPKEKCPEKAKVCGLVTSTISHRLFNAIEILRGHLSSSVNAHLQLHEDESESEDGHDCLAFHTQLEKQLKRTELLEMLLWLSVAEEHPQVASNDTKIYADWKLTSTNGKWNASILPTDPASVSKSFISRLTAIACGRRISVVDEPLGPVGSDEVVIGSLQDERVQALRSLHAEIKKEYLQLVPPDVLKDPANQRKMTIEAVENLMMLGAHFKKLAETTMSIFWCGIRDTVPEAADAPHIAVRRAWEVVKCPDEEDVATGLLASLLATALRVKIPGGEASARSRNFSREGADHELS